MRTLDALQRLAEAGWPLTVWMQSAPMSAPLALQHAPLPSDVRWAGPRAIKQ